MRKNLLSVAAAVAVLVTVAGCNKPAEYHRRKALLYQIARAQQRPMPGEREHGLFESGGRAHR